MKKKAMQMCVAFFVKVSLYIAHAKNDKGRKPNKHKCSESACGLQRNKKIA